MKKLIHEIHRRSLWQVLGIYLAGSWVALQVVEQLTEAAGLPEWVRPFSLVLLILGFPIVMATAFVQEGISTRTDASGHGEAAARSVSNEDVSTKDVSAETDSAAPVSAQMSSRSAGVFTWKNAVMGGGAAFALLGVLTAGYLFMRSAGIGPAGTLVAQGVLEEGADVLLVPFESANAELADVVTGALRIDLVQSPTIRLVNQAEISAGLGRMARDEDEALTSATARELALREGFGAIIEGEIGSAGSGYLITASILGGEGWEPLAAFRATADGDDDVIDAIESLSRDIRDKAGESLRSVAASPGLRQVTTGSFEALRTYSRAASLEDAGDYEGALDLYERTVELDPEFAMAHRKIGVQLGNSVSRRGDEVAALTRAYELRDKLPPIERYLAEGYYHSNVAGDVDAAVRAYEAAMEADPRGDIAPHNLAVIIRDAGRLEEALPLFEMANSVAPGVVGYENIARTQMTLGEMDAAMATLDSGIVRLPEAASVLEEWRFDILWLGLRFEEADLQLAGHLERFPGRHAQYAVMKVQSSTLHGRLQEAEPYIDAQAQDRTFAGNPMNVAATRASLAIVRGRPDEGATIMLESLEEHRDDLSPANRLYGVVLNAVVASGDANTAERVWEEWLTEVPESHAQGETYPGIRRMRGAAMIAFARGQFEESLRLWEAYGVACRFLCQADAALGTARTHEAGGDLEEAAAAYAHYVEATRTFRLVRDERELPAALERLGQLNEELGDLDEAAHYYQRFVDLWRDADEDLQPRVRAAQARLDALDAQAAVSP